jgi:hyaluronan synthase
MAVNKAPTANATSRRNMITEAIGYLRSRSITAGLAFFFMIYVLLVYKILTLGDFGEPFILMAYSFLVLVYILSRFALAHFYDGDIIADRAYEPTITFVSPCKNEEENIGGTLGALLQSEYPAEKMEIIVINDGSTDQTLERMMEVKRQADRQGLSMTVVNWTENKGKRHGMAEGTRLARGEVIIFVDSDSYVIPSTAREIVKYFANRRIGAVSGHCDVYNRDKNILTKMQAVRFMIAFKAYKAAEAIFGTVTCASGCLAAYRREYIVDKMDEWLNQRFLGAPCTYGDDRALTNLLLKGGYDAIYSEAAYARTVVPDTWSKFMKQQLRWKKSWTRESLMAFNFMWKRNPLAFASFAIGVILPLLAPFIVVRAFIYLPLAYGIWPFVYVAGLIFMSCIYGIYYRIYRKDKIWVYGMVFTWLYTLVLIWQLPYAILTLRDSRWGTR